MVYKLSGEELFEVPFDNGSIKGFVTYKDKDKKVPIEFDKTTGWFTLDKEKGICINSKGELFRGELDAKTKLPTKGILSRRNGITLEGVFNEEGLLTSGKITQANGDYECGKFDTDGKLRRNYEYYIKKTRKKGDIAEISGAGDSSEKRFILGNRGVRMYFCYDKDSHLIGQDILLDEPKTYGEGERAGQINFNKIGNTKKLSSIKFDKDDFSEGPVTYYSYNTNGKPGATVKVDYGKLNEILSKGEIKNENDFMKSGAIVVNPRAKTFKKAQKALRIVQELMFKNRSRGGAQGFDGGYSEEINLGILANLKDFKGLKRVRFQELRAGNEVYKSPTKFLESLGISAGNIGSIEEDFISVSVSIFAEDIGHEVTLVLDMKKIKKIAKEKGFDGINDSNETLFKCFDTSRLVIEDSFREVLDGLAKNTALVKDFVIQKGGSCWEQSTAATIAVAENKELMKKAKSININSPIFTSSYASFPKGKYARDVLSNPIAVAQLREQLDIAKNNEVDLGTGKNLMEHIINSVIIDSLKEFSKTEKLLEEYDKRVQSLREERLKNKDKESKDKDKEPEEEFEKLVKEERDKLSKEITVENKKTEKEEEEELKGLGETAKKDWKSLSNFLEKKFKKEYANTCKDLDAGIKYDPTIAKKTIDLARTIAKKLGDNTQEKKALEIAMTKIEKSNGAYVDYLKKSLENSTRILRRGLDNIEKLNERIKSLRTHLEKEVVVEKVEEELNTKKNDESYFAGVSAPVSDSVEKFTSSPLASTLRLTSTSSSTGDPSSKTPPNVPKNKTQEQRKVNI
jgi:hypothetical protein